MLKLIHDQLRTLYAVDGPEIAPFVVDEAALHLLMGGPPRPADEFVLVRQGDDGLELAVWVAEDLMDRLDRAAGPAEAVRGDLRAVCAAVEAASHFLLLVDRGQREESVSLLDLEAQAEVDKFVFASLHQPRRPRELLARLFERAGLQDDLSPEEHARYVEAGRLASAFCAAWARETSLEARARRLREFWKLSSVERLGRMRDLAA